MTESRVFASRRRIAIVLATTTLAGLLTGLLIHDDWIGYAYGASGLAALVFVSLAAASADQDRARGSMARIALWLVVGMHKPKAAVRDMQALLLFFLVLSYTAGLTVGVFCAVRL